MKFIFTTIFFLLVVNFCSSQTNYYGYVPRDTETSQVNYSKIAEDANKMLQNYLTERESKLKESQRESEFIRKYTKVITKESNILGDWNDISLTVVFNEKDTDDIVFYYGDGSVKRFNKIGNAIKDKTISGQGYQSIMCLDRNDGRKLAILLFDNDITLRVLISKETYVEFHR